MTTMDCKDIKALLSAIIDDELDADRRHAAERHLADCAKCRAIVNEAEGLNDLIVLDAQAQIDGITLPPGFKQRVLQHTVYADGMPPAGRRWSMWAGWFAAAASLTLAAVLWITDRPQPGQAGDSFAMGGHDSMIDPGPSQAPASSGPVIRPASYTTGVDLRSQTFDGGLPAEAFRIHRVSLADVTMPYDPVFFPDRDAAPVVMPGAVGQEPPPARAAAPLTREDADALYSAALLIEMFADADLSSFVDVERIRQVIEVDELLPRISTARERLSGEARTAVFAAESVLLRIAHGPLDRDDAIALQRTVDHMNLAAEIEAMSEW